MVEFLGSIGVCGGLPVLLVFRWFPAVFSLRVVLEFCAGRRGAPAVKFAGRSALPLAAARGLHAPPPAAARGPHAPP